MMSDEELLAATQGRLPPLAADAHVPTFGVEPMQVEAARPLTQADLQSYPADYARLTAPPPVEQPAPSSFVPAQAGASMAGMYSGAGAAGSEPYRSTSHTTTTRMSMAPEERAAMADMAKVQAGQEGNIAARGKLLAQGAGIGAEEASARESFAAGRIGQIEQSGADDKAAWDGAMSKVADETRKLKDTQLTSWWDSRSTGQKIAAALSVAIGTMDGRGGFVGPGGNTALSIINSSIAQHRADQLDKIERQKDNVAMARMGVKDAMMAREMQRTNLDAKTAAQYDALASKFATQKAKLGVPAAEIESDQLIQDLRANAAAQRQAVYQGLRTKTTSDTVRMTGALPGAGGRHGAGTEDQRSSDFIFKAALPDAQLLLESGGLSLKSRKALGEVAQRREAMPGLSKTAEWLGVASTPEEVAQKLGNREAAIKGAEDRSLIYIQRKLSGAGMAEGEAARMSAAFRGSQFDSPKIARAKAENMARFIFETGQQGTDPVRAARMAEAAIFGAEQGKAASQATRNIMYNGKPATQHPDGSISYR
jgi:hypothetical protein